MEKKDLCVYKHQKMIIRIKKHQDIEICEDCLSNYFSEEFDVCNGGRQTKKKRNKKKLS